VSSVLRLPRSSGVGYHGRILHVDLSSGALELEQPGEAWFRNHPGGGLLALAYLLGSPAGDDPLVFASSVVAGHPAVALPRFTVAARSPLTGGFGESRAEGPWALALKASGVDAVVVRGQAAAPTYLLVASDRVSLEPADDLWGTDAAMVTDRLRGRHGPGAHVATIGRAGEAQVRFASIVTDRYFPAPRMGMGAVMGAKRLKAVVLVGGQRPSVADGRALGGLTESYAARMTANPQTRVQRGLPGFGLWINAGDNLAGYLGVENYRTSKMPDLSGFADHLVRPYLVWDEGGCPGCPNACIKGYRAHGATGGLHQEALAALGPNLGVTDLSGLFVLNARCQRWGLDPVSLGYTLSWLFEAVEAGLVPGEATGAAGFGDGAAVARLAEAVALREGPGAWLAEGVQRAADRFGPDAARLAMHVKGLELPPFDPRASAGQALAYAVSPVGPRYDMVEHDIDFDPVDGHEYAVDAMRPFGLTGPLPMASLDDDKVRLTSVLLDLWSGLDVLNLCLYAGPPVRLLTLDDMAAIVRAVTGWSASGDDIMGWGRRRLKLAAEYNRGQGLSEADEWLPERFFDEPIDTGRHAGAVLDRTRFAAAIAQFREWAG
jgi:aldehyde:ferredoxin oxidoreductase